MRALVIDGIGEPVYEVQLAEVAILLGKDPAEVEEMEAYWIDYLIEYSRATRERDYKRKQINKALTP